MRKVRRGMSNELEITELNCGLSVLVTDIFRIPPTECFQRSAKPSIMLESIQ